MFTRLCLRAGPAWPLGTDATETPAIMEAEKQASVAVVDYIKGSYSAKPRDKLAEYERLMCAAIDAALSRRGCEVCGIEKVVEIVDKDGGRMCGRCRAGIKDG